MSVLIQLNMSLRDNYMFMDSEAPICLNMNNPRGFAPRLTHSILKGLKHGTLIDVNHVVDLTTGKLRAQNQPVQPVGEPICPRIDVVPPNGAKEEIVPPVEPPVEQVVVTEPTTETPVDVPDKKKSGKKTAPTELPGTTQEEVVVEEK